LGNRSETASESNEAFAAQAFLQLIEITRFCLT
jgi:hypothetical protein